MLLRILTALVLIPIVVALVWWGPAWVLAIVAAGVAILALVEFFELGERVGLRAFRAWTIVCAGGIFYAQYSLGLVETHSLTGSISIVRHLQAGTVPIEIVLLIFVLGAAGIGLGTRRAVQDVLPGLAVSSAGLLFIALPFSYLVRLDEIERNGRELVLFTLLLVWAGDMLAYFVGQGLGRIPMAPALSPKKTWEGALGNLVGSMMVAVIFARWMQVDALTLLVIAGLGNIAGQAGDLIESAYKRGAGVKDSGTILPGHGGILDRIDSLILAAPVVWAAYEWLGKQ
jgi:phosphatidate cytidylyltransferase